MLLDCKCGMSFAMAHGALMLPVSHASTTSTETAASGIGSYLCVTFNPSLLNDPTKRILPLYCFSL